MRCPVGAEEASAGFARHRLPPQPDFERRHSKARVSKESREPATSHQSTLPTAAPSNSPECPSQTHTTCNISEHICFASRSIHCAPSAARWHAAPRLQPPCSTRRTPPEQQMQQTSVSLHKQSLNHHELLLYKLVFPLVGANRLCAPGDRHSVSQASWADSEHLPPAKGGARSGTEAIRPTPAPPSGHLHFWFQRLSIFETFRLKNAEM